MSTETTKALYNRYAPRWVKVIKWDVHKRNFVERSRYLAKRATFPLLFFSVFAYGEYGYVWKLFWHKPKTDEERMELKNICNTNVFYRDYVMGQFINDLPPIYDLSERRKKYPQYYAGRYDGFKKYSV